MHTNVSGGAALADEPRARTALLWLYFMATLTGASFVLGRGPLALLLSFAGHLGLGFLPFLWYCRDGNGRNFRRSIWWNMGMSSFLVPTVFIYLWRTRPRGKRLRALVGALACFALAMLAGCVGMVSAFLLSTLMAAVPA